MTNLLGETTPAVDCSPALIQRQVTARQSMRINEGIRLTREAAEQTNDSVRIPQERLSNSPIRTSDYRQCFLSPLTTPWHCKLRS